jgi:hypothetical protein
MSGEVSFYTLATRCAHRPAPRGVRDQLGDRVGEAHGVTGPNEQSGHPVHNLLSDCANVTGDDRQTACHRLEHRKWRAIIVRGKNKNVSSTKQFFQCGGVDGKIAVNVDIVTLLRQ